MENEKSKQVRSISVNTDIYNKFRTICTVKGLIMSVQFEHMMQVFIKDYTDKSDISQNPETTKNN